MEDIWLDAQMRRCTIRLQDAISAVHLTMHRPAFGQSITPKRGSVLASPAMANWNPEPDYFFHWLRDSALVMDAVTTLGRRAVTPAGRSHWKSIFDDFVAFSLDLNTIDGGNFLPADYRTRVDPGCHQYLRDESDMALVRGDAVLGEPRFNPDGTPDTHRWARPQYDGAALRAITGLRHWQWVAGWGCPPAPALAALIFADLDFTLSRADHQCIGPWETDHAVDHHYYTTVTQCGALHHGALWAAGQGDAARAALYGDTARALSAALDLHWDDQNKFYRAARARVAADAEDHLDISVIMGVNHAHLPGLRHSVNDDRVRATLVALETMFIRDYPINAGGVGPAMGRFKSDVYFSGGAYYFSTFAAAEFYYRLATAGDRDLIARGDAIMALACRTIPLDGHLSEQFSKVSGEQNSARDLTWSYASFIAAYNARQQALVRHNTPLHRVILPGVRHG